jgi:hypothetical protein
MTIMAGSVHSMLAGMVIIVLPALVICLGIAIVAYRRRDQFAGRVSGRPVRPVRSRRDAQTLRNSTRGGSE